MEKLKFFIIFINGGILSLTDSHHHHHGQKPTMVGICHGGNVPVSHHHHHHHKLHHHHHQGVGIWRSGGKHARWRAGWTKTSLLKGCFYENTTNFIKQREYFPSWTDMMIFYTDIFSKHLEITDVHDCLHIRSGHSSLLIVTYSIDGKFFLLFFSARSQFIHIWCQFE